MKAILLSNKVKLGFCILLFLVIFGLSVLIIKQTQYKSYYLREGNQSAWHSFSIKEQFDGKMMSFGDDATSVVVESRNIKVFGSDKKWKTLQPKNIIHNITKDGGNTYQDITNEFKNEDLYIFDFVESVVVDSKRQRIFIRSTRENARYLWSIPYDDDSKESYLVTFSYKESPQKDFYIPGDNLKLVGTKILIDVTTSNGGSFITTDNNGKTWKRIIDFNKTIKSFDFIDDKQGWLLLGDKGLLKTINGGETWENISSVPNESIFSFNVPLSMSFCNENKGIIVGLKGLVLETENGGLDWTQHHLDTEKSFYRVLTNKNCNAWILGANGLIIESLDFGKNWESYNFNIKNPIFYGLNLRNETPYLIYEDKVFTKEDKEEIFNKNGK